VTHNLIYAVERRAWQMVSKEEEASSSSSPVLKGKEQKKY